MQVRNLSNMLKERNAEVKKDAFDRAHNFLQDCQLDSLIEQSFELFVKKIGDLNNPVRAVKLSLLLQPKAPNTMFDLYEKHTPTISDVESQIESEFNLRGYGNIEIDLSFMTLNYNDKNCKILVGMELSPKDF